jgi:hypothetical protein
MDASEGPEPKTSRTSEKAKPRLDRNRNASKQASKRASKQASKQASRSSHRHALCTEMMVKIGLLARGVYPEMYLSSSTTLAADSGIRMLASAARPRVFIQIYYSGKTDKKKKKKRMMNMNLSRKLPNSIIKTNQFVSPNHPSQNHQSSSRKERKHRQLLHLNCRGPALRR